MDNLKRSISEEQQKGEHLKAEDETPELEAMRESDVRIEGGYYVNVDALAKLDELANKVSKLVWYGCATPDVLTSIDDKSKKEDIREHMKLVEDEFPTDIRNLKERRDFEHGRRAGQLEILDYFFGPLDGCDIHVTGERGIV